MNDKEKYYFNKMMGLFAYDKGGIDSGIHDEVLKDECREWLHSLPYPQLRVFLALTIRRWITDEAIVQGYGAEDVRAWFDWLGDEMQFDI